MERYNVVVLGAGSGGLTVAAGAAMLGARVALLEKHRMGGDCLNYCCVPSKALLKAAKAETVRLCNAVQRVDERAVGSRSFGTPHDRFLQDALHCS